MFREQVLQHYREKGYALRERVKVRGASGTVHACDLVAQGPLGNLVVQFEDYGGFEGPELEAVRRIARDVGATPVVAAEDASATVRRHAAQLGVVVMDAQALTTPVVAEVQATVDREPDYPAWPDPDRPRRSAGRSGSRAEHPGPDADAPRTRVPSAEPAHSWPADGRSRPEGSPRMDPGEVDDLVTELTKPQPPAPTRRQDPGFWKYGRDGEAAPESAAPVAPAKPSPERSNSATGFSWLGSGLQASDMDRIDALTDRAPAAPPAPVAPKTVPAERRPKQVEPEAASKRSLRWLVGPLITGGAAGAVFFGLAAFFGLL